MGEILIAGLGSAGRRHLANLRALGWRDVRCYRTGLATLPAIASDLAVTDHDLDTALARRPVAVIVSNPSACHLPIALAAARAGAHLLIEKPLSHDLADVAELERVVAARGVTVLMGFQFRFNPGVRQLRTWIRDGAIGAVVSAQVHWGEYLPDMHPWEDYRTGYAARPELGGGVLLTLCHPFDYLRWLIGEIDEVRAVESRRDQLGLTVETCVDVTLRFACGASGHVHLNFVQRPPAHHVTIVGTEGTVVWDQTDHVARLFTGASQQWEIVPPPSGFDRNVMFLEEMRHFLASLRDDDTPICTLADGRTALEVVLAAKRSLASVSALALTP